ncbi:MAG: DUF1588 domain-containing protein [Gemmataceae bacterium]
MKIHQLSYTLWYSILCAVLMALVAAAFGQSEAEPNPGQLQYASAAESKTEYDRMVTPFLTQHCLSCHNAKRSEGDLDLTALDPDMKASTSGARWAMVVEQLSQGKMPPPERSRPPAESVAAVIRWAQAEAKRAGKHFTRRDVSMNGNALPHHLLFDPKHLPQFNAGPAVRRLSPEIYSGFLTEVGKSRIGGLGQPFSPEGKQAFKDMGAPKIDEPVTVQLLHNALLIVEHQTAHKIENGEIKKIGFPAKELLALFDPQSPPTEDQIEAALTYQFNTILKRPPTESEKTRFMGLMKKNIADAGQTIGARYTLAAVLLLPEAVFRLEVGSGQPDEKGRVRLAPRAIAFALSYALTDRRPDAELLTAAATGGLDTDAGVAQQVRRLLDNPKIEKPRIPRFFREYFGYDKAIEVFKDNKDNPEHDPRILVEDTDRLIAYILEQDQDVLRELLTTTKSFVAYRIAEDTKKKRAEALAKFEADKAKNPEKFQNKTPPRIGRSIYEAYGLDDFPDVQPVELPADQRAGILMQPSWLVAQSTSFDNHAIHRGKWIRERLLGGVVPDIPITVDAQLPDEPDKTLRQRMAVTQQAYCWKCHQFMNDLGLPFEQFDHFGRFRAAEMVLDQEATAKNVDNKGKPLGPVLRAAPLDTTGFIAHVGDPALEGPVPNPVELMKKLAASERVEQVFVRHAFRYWLGRNETPGDAASLQAAHRAYRDSGGSMKALITALLSSESFLYRVPDVTETQ